MFYLIALKYEKAVNVSWEGLHGLVSLWSQRGRACRIRPLPGRGRGSGPPTTQGALPDSMVGAWTLTCLPKGLLLMPSVREVGRGTMLVETPLSDGTVSHRVYSGFSQLY